MLKEKKNEELRKYVLDNFKTFNGAISRVFENTCILKPEVSLLLELYEAEKRGNLLSASCVGLDAEIPQTTSIRHIRHLENRGWIMRIDSKNDRRIQFLRITPSAMLDVENALIS